MTDGILALTWGTGWKVHWEKVKWFITLLLLDVCVIEISCTLIAKVVLQVNKFVKIHCNAHLKLGH